MAIGHSIEHDNGLFITMEGVEGCGKSTQTRMLVEWCINKGHECLVTREPGGTPLGERVRDVVLDPSLSIDPMSELFLYLAARAEHVRSVIRPALEKGVWVVSDRFADSTTAYQGTGRELGPEFVDALNLQAADSMEPDITFVFDVGVEEGLARAREVSDLETKLGGDRIESDTIEFHQKVAHGFRDLAERSPERVVLIERGGIDEVHELVIRHMEAFLEVRGL
jgi:dTMP kinase